MRVFAFDPAAYRDEYRDRNYVHIKNGVAPEFLDYLQQYARERLVETNLEGYAIKGKKQQALFEFPDSVDYPAELFDAIATMCGLNRPRMTLSERHIQAYESNAAPEPLAHKDRYASLVSVGLSIDIPAESCLVLYPYEHRGLNAFNRSAAFPSTLQPDETPDVVARTARAVVLNDEPGDVVAFPGSTTWHLRRNAANSINLYLKFNDFDCDPLGEDPSTDGRRRATEAALATRNDDLRNMVAVMGRRLDLVTRHYTRNWEEVLQATVYDAEPFGLSQTQYRILQILQAADGERTVAAIAEEIGEDGATVEAAARLLAEKGALDLVQ
jgi:hypothetical protein